MTALDLFSAMRVPLQDGIRREYGDYQGCILATRVALEVAHYFRVPALPMATRVILYNAAYQKRLDSGETPDIKRWTEEGGEEYSVGIGWGSPLQEGKWDGHLIAVGFQCFADFTIQQAERLDRGIVTGEAVIGPFRNGLRAWKALNGQGTVIEYKLLNDARYQQAPDWRDERRIRKIAGPVIRAVRKEIEHA